jgi:Asp-tRNA(Asn)/Glu-tRNA(Gln) amidotransferase A subunit family amidase
MKPVLGNLTVADLRARLAGGEIRAVDVVESCLRRIEEVDADVQAWAYLDEDYALSQAKVVDEWREAGKPLGPLHGVPVAVKDNIDTRDMPTEYGTPICAGRQPTEDATVVARLREAGAIVLGKTVATEFAFFTPNETRNPHDRTRTPGGSSSGSAAAVAAHMVPLAVGTQTAGSVIRPASFCGIVGYKPTHGLISRHGVLSQSRRLDTIGTFGVSVEDAALLAENLIGFDGNDPDTKPMPRPRLAETALSEPPLTPLLAFVKSPAWSEAHEDTQEAFAELVEFLGDTCDSVDLPKPFDGGLELHRTIMLADVARSYAGFYERARDQMSDMLRALIEEGRTILAFDYNLAADWTNALNAGLERIFDRYDAILTPAVAGEAPLHAEGTGSPAFCALWTMCGTPAVSLPLLQGANGLPIGVQLVGRRGDDGRLLRTARWLEDKINAEA